MIDQLVYAALIALAGYRLWRIAAVDTITEPIHGRLAMSENSAAQWVHALISCPWCLPFWVNGAITGALTAMYGWDAPTFALTWLASCTLTGVLGDLWEGEG